MLIYRESTYIWCIGDEFSQENILVAIEGIDDDIHKPRHFSLEFKLLCMGSQSLSSDWLSLPENRNLDYQFQAVDN